ncbi:MAG: hypothetical protein Greene101447_99 [Parcubacteria group bacterium Greene1014_47]|nr:MAG: hypothetical protein Greene101447_99 [Parcubacteria group bacterium Greene1014_47]
MEVNMFYLFGLKFGTPPTPTPTPPANPYTQELELLDDEFRDVSQRLTLALRYQRLKRMEDRAKSVEKEAGIAPKATT